MLTAPGRPFSSDGSFAVCCHHSQSTAFFGLHCACRPLLGLDIRLGGPNADVGTRNRGLGSSFFIGDVNKEGATMTKKLIPLPRLLGSRCIFHFTPPRSKY